MPARLRLLMTALLALAMALAVAGAATARRPATGAQKRAIMTAAGLRRATPLRCYRVEVSTANPAWAATQYAGASAQPCISYAADGVSITHFVRGRWRFVTAGSAFTCPIPGHIPAAVQRDLRLACIRG